MMSGIRSTETKAETAIRRALHHRGFRFRKNARGLPGTPDILLPKYRAAIFINGCFWHGHNCKLFKLPSSRTEFWLEKIEKNKQRDIMVTSKLLADDWRVLTIWECAFKGTKRKPWDNLVGSIAAWITGNLRKGQIRGEGNENV